jgi:hypothetical protein
VNSKQRARRSSLLDAAAYGLRRLPRVRLERAPRMADFALWATACETALWPPGTVARAYDANRRAAIEGVIEADPVAALCGRSWPSAAHGWEGPRIFCVRVPPQREMGRIEPQAGREIRVPLQDACAVVRPSSGPPASRLCSAAKAQRAAG